jgi:hypothetical protein
LRNSALSFSYSSFLTSQKVVSLSCVWHMKHRGFQISHSQRLLLLSHFRNRQNLLSFVNNFTYTTTTLTPSSFITTHIYSFNYSWMKGASGIRSLDST